MWLPELGKLVTTSEVYFEENIYPWRKQQLQPLPAPAAPPATDPVQHVGMPAAGFSADHDLPAPTPSSIGEAWAAATRRGALMARPRLEARAHLILQTLAPA